MFYHIAETTPHARCFHCSVIAVAGAAVDCRRRRPTITTAAPRPCRRRWLTIVAAPLTAAVGLAELPPLPCSRCCFHGSPFPLPAPLDCRRWSATPLLTPPRLPCCFHWPGHSYRWRCSLDCRRRCFGHCHCRRRSLTAAAFPLPGHSHCWRRLDRRRRWLAGGAPLTSRRRCLAACVAPPCAPKCSFWTMPLPYNTFLSSVTVARCRLFLPFCALLWLTIPLPLP